MTHEYPPNRAFDSVSISRVSALREYDLTLRQREFLVTVMVHSGCFLERQYCEFTSTVRGQNSREFMARLVARGFARAIEPGAVRRGRLYHIHHKPLYEAIGQADNRNRRLRTIGRMVERVMILDALLGDRRCWWLSPECDKRAFFDLTQQTGLGPEDYPHIAFGAAARKTIRCFPDKLPIGIEKDDTSRFVFLYLVNRRIPLDFRQFVIRHADLFRVLHHWTIRLLLPQRFRKAAALYKAALREQLWTPLNPSVTKSLETYFRERQDQGGHLAVGLRLGEALGLGWDDVDLTAKTLRIRRALQRVEKKLVFVEPKSERSRRTVSLPDFAITALKRQRTAQKEERLKAGSKWNDSGLVFTSSIGTPLDERNVRREFDEILKAAKLPAMRIHDLRHTCASLLLAQGVHPRVVMETLGHSQISLTRDTYSHVLPALGAEAATKMDLLVGVKRGVKRA